MPEDTPILGLTIPLATGDDLLADWPGIDRQGLLDLDNTLTIPLDSKAATDSIASWPNGFSLMGVSQANGPGKGWPDLGGGVIFTMHRANEVLAHQWYLAGSLLSQIIVQIRAGTSDGWSAWKQIVSDGTPRAMASGQITIPGGAGVRQAIVLFPTNRFINPPRVTVSNGATNRPDLQTSCSYDGVSATQMTVYVNRTDAVSAPVAWQAVEGVE